MTDKLFKVKISTKGQLVIPKNIRDVYGLREGDVAFLIPREEGLLIKKYEVKGEGLRGLLRDIKVDPEECEAILKEAKRTIVKVKA